MTLASTLVSLRPISASYSGIRATSEAGLSPPPRSGRRRGRAAQDSGDEAGLGGQGAAGGGQRRAPGDEVSLRLQTAFQRSDGGDDIRLVHSAEVSAAENLAGEFALPLADNQAEIPPGLEHRL